MCIRDSLNTTLEGYSVTSSRGSFSMIRNTRYDRVISNDGVFTRFAPSGGFTIQTPAGNFLYLVDFITSPYTLRAYTIGTSNFALTRAVSNDLSLGSTGFNGNFLVF